MVAARAAAVKKRIGDGILALKPLQKGARGALRTRIDALNQRGRGFGLLRQPRNRALRDGETACKIGLRRDAGPQSVDRLGELPPVSVGGRPIWTPRALARVRPSPVRARINSRSNSARPPTTVDIKRPCGVVVWADCRRENGIRLQPSPLCRGCSRGRAKIAPTGQGASQATCRQRQGRVTPSPARAGQSWLRSPPRKTRTRLRPPSTPQLGRRASGRPCLRAHIHKSPWAIIAKIGPFTQVSSAYRKPLKSLGAPSMRNSSRPCENSRASRKTSRARAISEIFRALVDRRPRKLGRSSGRGSARQVFARSTSFLHYLRLQGLARLSTTLTHKIGPHPSAPEGLVPSGHCPLPLKDGAQMLEAVRGESVLAPRKRSPDRDRLGDFADFRGEGLDHDRALIAGRAQRLGDFAATAGDRRPAFRDRSNKHEVR